MKLKILGCSGGIGGDLRTTSMLLDDDVLIFSNAVIKDELLYAINNNDL